MIQMSLPLEEKVILVTGACGRLGKASVRMFLEQGAKVAAADIVPVTEQPFYKEWEEHYGENRLIGVQCNATVESTLR